ncbi:MAG: hypothetical protein ACOH2N_12605 [Devosia sp.]
MAELATHRAYLDAEMAAALAAPLARRKALLVAMLIDAYVDRLFAAGGLGDDILAFRAATAQACVPLGQIMALCAQRDEVRLVTEAVAIPIEDYGRLSVADFMVSLYNDHSVQRLLLVDDQGQRHDMLETLSAAIAALDMDA